MPLRPLEGFVVAVTADRRWQEQAELLTRRGASVLHCPTITTLYLASDDDLRRATTAVVDRPPDYLVVTTGIGIRAWLETAAAWGLGDPLVDALARSRIVARGPKAAAAVQAGGLEVWERSATEQMDNVLAVLLAEPLAGKRVAVQEYGMRSPELSATLAGAGADVVEVPVYRWRRPDDEAPALRLVEAATQGRLDAVTFTSAPAVHNLFAIAADHGVAAELRDALNGGVTAACVGPVCAEGARREGVRAPLVPAVGRLGLLVRALSDHFADRRRTFVLDGTPLGVQGAAVLVGETRQELTPRERGVFELLADAHGAVVPRQRLLASVWGSADADPHVLEVTVARLRRRLGPCGAAVETVPGRGYRINPGHAGSDAAVM
jgi:uroporphyrinogen-III synthase